MVRCTDYTFLCKCLGTGCCWSRDASDLVKTSCRQSLQAFVAGNSPLLRIFFIQYLLWELNMPVIQGWLQSVLGAKDFIIHLMFSILLVTSQFHLKSTLLHYLCSARSANTISEGSDLRNTGSSSGASLSWFMTHGPPHCCMGMPCGCSLRIWSRTKVGNIALLTAVAEQLILGLDYAQDHRDLTIAELSLRIFL